MKTNCLLCGIGGQGTVLASTLISTAALYQKLEVKASDTIGMAQRGGSVVSHVRFGKKIHSSLISDGEADVLIAFEPAEAVRHLHYLKKGGTVIVCTRPVIPVASALAHSYETNVLLHYLHENAENVIEVDMKKESNRNINIKLLATAVKSGVLGLSEESLRYAVEKAMPEKSKKAALHLLDEFFGA